MNLCDFVPEYIRAIEPYQPGKPISELARDLDLEESTIIKLASNENPLGTSPLALLAITKSLSKIAHYPDGSGFELKTALSSRYAVNVDQIILGNGSNDVLDLAVRVLLRPGAAAVYSQYAFAIYPLLVQAIGATGISVPAKDYGHDLFAMLDAITPKTRIVFIASLNNPTGTLSKADDLLHFLECVSQDVLVVLDEAYNEYLPEANKSSSITWLEKFPNLIIIRTFSKAYGLAGVRIGYGLTHPEVANLMNRVRQPFNVCSIGLVGALAAMQDIEFIQRVYTLNRAGMLQLTDGLRQLGVKYIPSHGNFICFCIQGGALNAIKVNKSLLQQGVIVRPLTSYGLPQHLRVTIGLDSENKKFLASLAHAIGELT